MKKKVIIAIIIIILLLAIGVGVFMLLNNGKNTEKSLDINLAGQTLANNTPFNEMTTMDITTNELSTLYGVNIENVENVVGKVPMMNVQASMYILIQAKNGVAETVKSELDKYATQYETQWSTYLPEQYEIVKNRKSGIIGNTVYMIIAENAEDLEQQISTQYEE